MRIRNIIITTLVILLLQQLAFSQVPVKPQDTKSNINISDLENINLSNGSLTFTLPLTSVGGRGLKNGVALKLGMRKWRRDSIIRYYQGAQPIAIDVINPDPYQLELTSDVGGFLISTPKILATYEEGQCSNEILTFIGVFDLEINFIGFNGDSMSFRSDQVTSASSPNPCNPSPWQIGGVFTTRDGSGTKFISDVPLLLPRNAFGEAIYPSGFIKKTDGSTYRVDSGLVKWLEDRNGNRTYTNTSSYIDGFGSIRANVTSVKDSLNREIQIGAGNVTYKGTGGVNRVINVNSCTDGCYKPGESGQTLGTAFPVAVHPTTSAGQRPIGGGNIKDVEFPDGRKYKFFYNSFEELARVELPTGGAIEYDFESIGGSMDRRIIERRVYSNGTTLDSKTKYVYSDQTSHTPNAQIPIETNTTVKVFDNQGNLKSMSKHYFYGCIQDNGSPCSLYEYEPPSSHRLRSGREYKSEIYDTNGTSVLRKVETEYQPRTQIASDPYLGSPYIDYRVVRVTNTLEDSHQVSKVEYGYDTTVDFNLQTDVYEYDYDNWQAGNLIRGSHTAFSKATNYTNNSVNLKTLPIESWVTDSVNTIVSRTKYEYDNYASGGNTAPLHDRANITGHNSALGTSYTTRGNTTKVTTYADAQNQNGAVSVHTQYDIAGNVVKAIDAKGNASTMDYTDKFGTPDAEARSTNLSLLNGLQTYAFLTSATNIAGYQTFAQYDYHSGAAVDTEDIIGNVSTIFYNDVLDRPTQTISANNRPNFRRQSTIVYDDLNRKVTSTADSKTFGDNLLKSESFYDGLGRTFESRSYENATDYVVGFTQYDSLGRAYKSSNPYRPYLNEQPIWTTSYFDDLGRVTKVKSPDNGEVNRTYYGSSVRIFDQAGRSRAGVSDALSRLTKVIEYDNGADLETTYTFDVLGRLRKTTQGTQNRYFMYNDLGRLIRAKQPEQIANTNLTGTDPITNNSNWSVSYAYDNNGNIISTTDTRNKTITGTYDNLNRLTLRDYSDATPDVSFAFDNPNIPNSKGQLTAINSNISANYYTSFDELGRIKSSQQQMVGGQTYNFPNYTYDLSGALVQQTYPSGRIVNTESDTIGRLSKVTSQIPTQVEKTYLSNLRYTSFGGVSQAKLGNGRWESMQFDSKTNQTTQIGLGFSATNTNLLKIEYNYGTTTATSSDNNGSLRQQKISYAGQTAQITQNYSYDMLNRLKSATESVNGTTSWKQTFDYDRYGNRRFDANNTTTLQANNGIYNPNIDPNTNKFLVSEGYNYDSEGNLTSNPESQLFQYDAENRQTQVTNSASNTTANYQYDGSGKRVRKLVGNEETIFVYDAFGKMVAEYSNVIETRPKSVSYLTADALGSPRIITDQTGNVISRHDYMPFGEEVMSGTGGRLTTQGYAGNDGVKQQFTGYERDAESGLDYAQARYFASKHGRFTSVDPLTASANMKNPQTFNRYSYVMNSPYKFVDPLGLKAVSSIGSSFTENEYDGTKDKLDDGEEEERKLALEKEKQRSMLLTDPTITITSVSLVDRTDGQQTVLVKGSTMPEDGGKFPAVDASSQIDRIKQGAKLFLRVDFAIDDKSNRSTFTPSDNPSGSESFSNETKSTAKWKVRDKDKKESETQITVDAAGTTATVYVPINFKDGTNDRISIRASASYTDGVNLYPKKGEDVLNVPKSVSTVFDIRVKFVSPADRQP